MVCAQGLVNRATVVHEPYISYYERELRQEDDKDRMVRTRARLRESRIRGPGNRRRFDLGVALRSSALPTQHSESS